MHSQILNRKCWFIGKYIKNRLFNSFVLWIAYSRSLNADNIKPKIYIAVRMVCTYVRVCWFLWCLWLRHSHRIRFEWTYEIVKDAVKYNYDQMQLPKIKTMHSHTKLHMQLAAQIGNNDWNKWRFPISATRFDWNCLAALNHSPQWNYGRKIWTKKWKLHKILVSKCVCAASKIYMQTRQRHITNPPIPT